MILLECFLNDVNKANYCNANNAIRINGITYQASYFELSNNQLNSSYDSSISSNLEINFLLENNELITILSNKNSFDVIEIVISNYIDDHVFIIFKGIINSFSINSSNIVNVKLESNNQILFPKKIISVGCQLYLYSKECGVNINNFKMSILNNIETIKEKEIVLRNVINNLSNYKNGLIFINDYKRIISKIVGKKIFLQTAIFPFEIEEVYLCEIAYGCNKTYSECVNKFNNNNFFGFDTVPKESPLYGIY